MNYKILFAGLGSIGTRHLRNVTRFLESRGDTFRIDALRHDINKPLPEETKQMLSSEYTYEDNVPEDYDILFVTNPTSLHYLTISKYIKNTRHMFIEKPVFDTYHIDIDKLCLRRDGVYYVACPLRYNPVLQYIKNNIDVSKAISVRSISSSYLPDWRKGSDYRQSYSARRNLGGGVILDLIHEWDYLVWFWGFPETSTCITGKFSALEIDSEDVALYIAKTKKTVIELHLDYFGRKPKRMLEIFFNDDFIEADILNKEIKSIKMDNIIKFNETRDDIQLKEIKHFFSMIEENEINDNALDKALKVLKIAQTPNF